MRKRRKHSEWRLRVTFRIHIQRASVDRQERGRVARPRCPAGSPAPWPAWLSGGSRRRWSARLGSREDPPLFRLTIHRSNPAASGQTPPRRIVDGRKACRSALRPSRPFSGLWGYPVSGGYRPRSAISAPDTGMTACRTNRKADIRRQSSPDRSSLQFPRSSERYREWKRPCLHEHAFSTFEKMVVSSAM